MPKIIAIDGPSGAGKSTISKAVAHKLNYNYVDTGAIYRTIALEVYNKLYGVGDFLNSTAKLNTYLDQNIEKLLELVDTISIKMFFFENKLKIISNGKDISKDIRKDEVSLLTSSVSRFEGVRTRLLDLQRDLANKTDKLASIIDGRDIGTVVFPNAETKIFLTASATERAKRRHKELLDKGEILAFDNVLNKIIERDNNDMSRPIAPLKKADDAIELNTDGMSFSEVVEKTISLIS